jgi:hypothetical protein
MPTPAVIAAKANAAPIVFQLLSNFAVVLSAEVSIRILILMARQHLEMLFPKSQARVHHCSSIGSVKVALHASRPGCGEMTTHLGMVAIS